MTDSKITLDASKIWFKFGLYHHIEDMKSGLARARGNHSHVQKSREKLLQSNCMQCDSNTHCESKYLLGIEVWGLMRAE